MEKELYETPEITSEEVKPGGLAEVNGSNLPS
jgi:hypothetical protein